MTSDDYQHALEQLQAGDWAGALQHLDQVLNQRPEFGEAFYQRGRVRAKLKDLPGAIADYTEAIRLQPTTDAFLNRAWTYLITGAAEAAIADVQQAIHLTPHRAEAHQILGSAYRQLGKTEQAIAAYKQAASHYIDQQDKAAAQACITQIEQLQVESRATVSQPTAIKFASPDDFIQQAMAKANRGKLSEALADLNWLLHLDPTLTEALCQRAAVQVKLGRAQAAVEDLARAIQADPENHAIRIQRGVVRLALGDVQGAIADFTDLIKQEPGNADLFAHRGHSYRQRGDWESAFKDYSNAIGIRPDSAELLEARADVQTAISEFEGALADYHQAATLWFNAGNWAAHQRVTAHITDLKQTLKQHEEARAAAKANLVRVPIKYRVWDAPVIEATFNNQHCFDMMLDTSSAITVITERIAQALRIQQSGHIWYRNIDGEVIQVPTGWIESVAVGNAIAICLQVAIADNDIRARLGQDFLRYYDIRVLSDEIELQYRSPHP